MFRVGRLRARLSPRRHQGYQGADESQAVDSGSTDADGRGGPACPPSFALHPCALAPRAPWRAAVLGVMRRPPRADTPGCPYSSSTPRGPPRGAARTAPHNNGTTRSRDEPYRAFRPFRAFAIQTPPPPPLLTTHSQQPASSLQPATRNPPLPATRNAKPATLPRIYAILTPPPHSSWYYVRCISVPWALQPLMAFPSIFSPKINRAVT